MESPAVQFLEMMRKQAAWRAKEKNTADPREREVAEELVRELDSRIQAERDRAAVEA